MTSYRDYRTIADMKIRETGYVVPWAYYDNSLDIDAKVYPNRCGTATMRVMRSETGAFRLLRERDALLEKDPSFGKFTHLLVIQDIPFNPFTVPSGVLYIPPDKQTSLCTSLCPDCGQDNVEDAVFCVECGATIDWDKFVEQNERVFTGSTRRLD